MSDQVEEMDEFVEIPKLYDDEINMNTACGISGLSAQRFRALTITGKVPTAQKNVQGFWKFSRAEVEKWAGERASSPRTHVAADGKKAFVVRLDPEGVAKFKATFPDTELSLRYSGRSKKSRAKKGKTAVSVPATPTARLEKAAQASAGSPAPAPKFN